jgi:hypothetical protein
VVSLTGKLTTRGEQTAPRWLVAVALVGGVFLQIGLAAAAAGRVSSPTRPGARSSWLACRWRSRPRGRRSTSAGAAENAVSAVAPWIALAVGQALFAAAGEPKRFLHLPGAHHNDVFEQTALLDAIADFTRAEAAAQ